MAITGMKKDITELYSFIDDFCQIYSDYEKSNYYPALNYNRLEAGGLISRLEVADYSKEILFTLFD
jgi:hypothetical protein